MEYVKKTASVFTDTAKLNGIEEGAQRHIPADWLENDLAKGAIKNKPTALEQFSNLTFSVVNGELFVDGVNE